MIRQCTIELDPTWVLCHHLTTECSQAECLYMYSNTPVAHCKLGASRIEKTNTLLYRKYSLVYLFKWLFYRFFFSNKSLQIYMTLYLFKVFL